ncbi:MAG: hypothetical protein WBW31_17665, partial [Candidatus Sulfotelmatobacter sp.]
MTATARKLPAADDRAELVQALVDLAAAKQQVENHKAAVRKCWRALAEAEANAAKAEKAIVTARAEAVGILANIDSDDDDVLVLPNSVALSKAAHADALADLLAREGGTRAVLGPVHDVPPEKRKRRRRRRHGAPNGVSVPRNSGTVPRRRVQVHRRKRPKPDVIEPVQVAAPVKAVRGAAIFAVELKAVDEIVAALAVADKALNKATRAKDRVGIAAASEEI